MSQPPPPTTSTTNHSEKLRQQLLQLIDTTQVAKSAPPGRNAEEKALYQAEKLKEFVNE